MNKILIGSITPSLLGGHAGIKFADINCNKSDDVAFVEKTTQALDLIRDLDPHRFARICRNIDFILNAELYSGGKYASGKICALDFGRWDFAQHPDWSLYMYAATIVHEATHGHLHGQGIRMNTRNKMRIEAACRREENRFLSRINSRWGDQLQVPFNPEDWNFGSPFRRVREVFRRMTTEKEKAQPTSPP